MTPRTPLLVLAVIVLTSLAPHSDAASIPPSGTPIPAEDRARLEEGVTQLGNVIRLLEKELVHKPDLLALMPDVQIYHKAVNWPLRFNEPLDVKKAQAALTAGMDRARQLKQGQTPWLATGGVRAYASKIDGSIQPYLVSPPKGYAPKKDDPTKYRLDFFFHGRSETLTELNFISSKGQEAPTAPPDDRRFVVFPYGRYCVANKFAGEIDTLEILDKMKSEYPIDEDRVLATGFSMGGAACWHMAVHYTDLWAAASPGAGFCETRVYQKMDNKGEWDALPAYQKQLMHLYDCPDYALNLSMLPTIAYAGELDPQQQSGDLMQKAMEALGLKLERVYGPNTAHKYEPKAKKDLAARLDAYAQSGRNTVPADLHFETWTLRYNRMHWLTVDGLEKHWDRARVDAKLNAEGGTISVIPKNVTAFTIRFAPGKSPFPPGSRPTVILGADAGQSKPLQGPPVRPDRSYEFHCGLHAGAWVEVSERPDAMTHKRHGLQGPIDDAFLDAFVFVKPTGQPMNAAVGKWVGQEFQYATTEWRKIFRGEAPVRNDTELSIADVRNNNLILFGDPSSNATLKQIADRLPIRWSADGIVLGDKTYPADKHALILICPNPLNPSKYVVLNSGFTFRQADHKTNSRQIAKLPDYAVVDLTTPPDDKAPGAISQAGLFDETWKLPKDATPAQ
jgi:pimeloyl-ACP methyl ester carboxylesterase